MSCVKVARGNFELDPVYHDSETHAAFKPRRRLNDVYGSPIIFTPTRNVVSKIVNGYDLVQKFLNIINHIIFNITHFIIHSSFH